MKKRIQIYNHPNEPYLEMLEIGANETPLQRYERFFLNRIKFRQIMGITEPVKRQIIIKKVEWI